MPGGRLTIGMRQGVVEAAVDDFGWRLRRGNAVVRVNSLRGLEFGVLNAFNDAVNALMPILLGGRYC
jgi:hypothetical protein